MKREQFIRQLQKLAKHKGLSLIIDKKKAKGSHYTLFCGAKRTIIKSGEITPMMAKIITKQLGL